MQLYVIRHGETYWNALRKLQGDTGSDLNEKGIRLAEITAQGLKDVPFDLCITSPLLRARHTAEIILKGRNVPVIEDSRIEEISFGDWEGKICVGPDIEIPADQFRVFKEDPFHFVPAAGGETIRHVIERTNSLLDELVRDEKLQDDTILISTHGCAARAFLNRLYKNPENFWQSGVPMNCSVSIVDIKDGKAELSVSDRIYYDPKYLSVDYFAGTDAVRPS